VCHESCTPDEGRSLGVGLHEQTSNRLERLCSKRHGRERQGEVEAEEMSESKPLTQVSKLTRMMSKPGSGRELWEERGGSVRIGRAASGIEAA